MCNVGTSSGASIWGRFAHLVIISQLVGHHVLPSLTLESHDAAGKMQLPLHPYQ